MAARSTNAGEKHRKRRWWRSSDEGDDDEDDNDDDNSENKESGLKEMRERERGNRKESTRRSSQQICNVWKSVFECTGKRAHARSYRLNTQKICSRIFHQLWHGNSVVAFLGISLLKDDLQSIIKRKCYSNKASSIINELCWLQCFGDDVIMRATCPLDNGIESPSNSFSTPDEVRSTQSIQIAR